MGTSFRKAADVLDVLERTHWTLFASLGRLKDDRADAAQRLLRELTEAMAADEYAVALGHRLPDLENRAVDLLARPVEPPPPTPPPPPPPPPGKGGASVREGAIVDEGSHSNLDRERLRAVTTRRALFALVPPGDDATAAERREWETNATKLRATAAAAEKALSDCEVEAHAAAERLFLQRRKDIKKALRSVYGTFDAAQLLRVEPPRPITNRSFSSAYSQAYG